MIGKYDNSPIHELYNALLKEFSDYYNFIKTPSVESKYYKIDDILKLILLNNGCKASSDEYKICQAVYGIIPNEYDVYFITGMLGNDANEFYDFVTFNGMKILVVFLDYFNFITNDDIDENDPMHQLKVSMGNSIYYDAIKKIVEVFYETSESMRGSLLTTSAFTNRRWNKAIIAIRILNHFKAVDENDVSDMDMKSIEEILHGAMHLQLYGIRSM